MKLTTKEAILLYKIAQPNPTVKELKEWLKLNHYTVFSEGSEQSLPARARKNIDLKWWGKTDYKFKKAADFSKFQVEIENNEIYRQLYIDLPTVTGEILGEVLETLI